MHKSLLLACFLGVSGLGLSSCGAGKAINATVQMNDKMTDTNKKIDKTNDTTSEMASKMVDTNSKIDQTNETTLGMAKTTLEMANKIDATNEKINATHQTMAQMNSKMAETNRKIDQTNEAMAQMDANVHDQALLLAKNDMLDPKNTQYMIPVPTGMMLGGKKFGEKATAEEIAELADLWLIEIRDAQPEDVLSMTDDQIGQVNHDKDVKFKGLEIIAGLAPQKTIEALVHEQVEQHGQYEADVYELLMLRQVFLSQVYLSTEARLDHSFISKGELDDSIEKAGYLDYLAALPFKDRLSIAFNHAFVSKDPHPSPDDDLNVQHSFAFVPDANAAVWQGIDDRCDLLEKAADGGLKNSLGKVKSHLTRTAVPRPA